MGPHFLDLLKTMKIDPAAEIERLNRLFFEKIGNHTTLAAMINEDAFRQLPFRGTFTSLDDMCRTLKIGPYQQDFTLAGLFLFSEFLLNILMAQETRQVLCRWYDALNKIAATIVDNIKIILDRTGYAIRETTPDNFIIVQDDPAAALAVEVTQDDAAALALLEYRHFRIQGHLEEKRKLLTAIGNYAEPILKSHTLKNNGFGALESDAGFLLNNFHIRHNNLTGSSSNAYVAGLTDTEREDWYDKTYQLLVCVVNQAAAIGLHTEVETAKAAMGLK